MFTIDQAGCLINGHAGWHAHYMIVDLAVDHGMTLSMRDARMLERYRSGDEIDHDVTGYVIDQGGLVDQAEAWLNDHAVPDGYMIHWQDGELFLSKACEDDRHGVPCPESCEVCADECGV